MSMKKRVLIVLVALCALSCAAPKVDELARNFVTPPDSARPWVYWFWLNGNITREGITADLEAMKRVGIGGVLIMEVDQGAPVGPADFMGAEWRELFKFAVAEAGRLGLEINMNDDAGWNGSGGPWIKPEQSMQKVVWTETALAGPRRLDATLPQPEADHGFYRDIAALAFPTPGGYRIADIKGKALYERRDRASGRRDGAAADDDRRPGPDRRPHRSDGVGRPPEMGCPGREVDGPPLRPHRNGRRERPSPRERPWPRVRQAQHARASRPSSPA